MLQFEERPWDILGNVSVQIAERPACIMRFEGRRLGVSNKLGNSKVFRRGSVWGVLIWWEKEHVDLEKRTRWIVVQEPCRMELCGRCLSDSGPRR